MCQTSLGGPSLAIPSPAAPRGFTCKAHGTEQFLKLLELPRGQEQMQGAQLSSHLQLEIKGTGGNNAAF